MKKPSTKIPDCPIAAFSDGMKSGASPDIYKNDQTLRALTSKKTPPAERAYWTGYLCRRQTDTPGGIVAL